MVQVWLRWCLSGIHSGCPFQYDVSETTTVGEICNLVLETNNLWWSQGHFSMKWSIVKICGQNGFLDNSIAIGGGHYQNKCVLVFDAA